MHFNTVKSSVWSLDQLNHGGRGLGWHEGPFSRDPLRIFSTRGPWGKIWHGQGCPFFDVVHPAFSLSITTSPTLQRAPKDRFCSDVWHARTIPVLVSWQMPEEVPVDPHGSCSWYAPSRWFCAPRCGEVSSCTWFRKSGSFLFQSQQAGYMFHRRRRMCQIRVTDM